MEEKIHLVYDGNLEVGENPLWDFKNERLLFLDIRGKCVYIKNKTGS